MRAAWAERRAWAIVGIVVAAVGVALVLGRDPLGRALFPDAALAGVLAEGDAALRRGDPDAAARAFEAAAAREPDHPRVRESLDATARAALAGIAPALAAGRMDRARTLLALATRLGAPGETLDAARRLVDAAAEPPVDVLLSRAVGREPARPGDALADYLAVLAREPANAVALDGRRRLLAARLAAARVRLDRAGPGDVEAAAREVEAVRALDPGHLDLPDLLNRLGARPDLAVRAGSAATRPSPAEAKEALRWRGLAEEALGRGEWARAREALARASVLDPGHDGQAALERRLADAGH